MVVLVALVGLFVGNLLNLVIARQLATFRRRGYLLRASGPTGWLPVVGSLQAREWVGLAVEVLCGLMAAALFLRYGLSLRSLLLFAASLVLIETGAIDFKIRMIDTLVLVVAMLAVLLLAPLISGGGAVAWLRSGLGLLVAGLVFLLLYGLSKVLFPGVAVPFGLGDVFLAAFIGALVGLVAVPTALFYGMLLAGLVAAVLVALRAAGRKVPKYIAYGTYLCLGTLLFLATRGF